MRCYWKVYCTEKEYPGLWHTWFREQVAAIGWAPAAGFRLREKGRRSTSWTKARNCLSRMQPGDGIVVQLPNNRVGRIGEVVELKVEDCQWNPTVLARDKLVEGEMGRRILVRWELGAGPRSEDQVVELPVPARLSKGQVRSTVAPLNEDEFLHVAEACRDPVNWVSLLSGFAYERSISEYIAAYPHRLEDGMRPYSDEKAHQFVFNDRKRADVLLIDSQGCTVVVECKQAGPTVETLDQVRGYVRRAIDAGLDRGKQVRGILVHGGASKVRKEVFDSARMEPRVEIVGYDVKVLFVNQPLVES